MTVVSIPSSIEQISPTWLAGATGLEIHGFEAEQIGVGIGVSSALYRLHLDGSDCPASVVVKLPALDEAAVFTSTILRMYHREVGFFSQLANQCPVRVPSTYHGAVDEETAQFVIVMEDMGAMRVVDQLDGMALSDAEWAVDALAAWQATWWREVDHLVESGTAIALDDPIYPAVLPLVFAEGWEKVTGLLELPESIRHVGDRWVGGFERLLADLAQGPNTLAHGDYRGDNIMFDDDGSVVLLDFQLIGSGSAAYDLAYFVTQSLDADMAATHEQALFDRWIDGLRAGGVAEADLDHMWEDYRKAALFCLCYPVIASRGMDFSDPRQMALVECMNSRYARAVEELALADLL
ncbi:MAG: phosphotransferase [Acidimicrobiales bacterium]